MKTLDDKRKGVGHRLAIIEGHLRKVRQMVDNGDYCIDIIHQSRAIQQALKKFDQQVLDGHMRTCVRRSMRETGGANSEKTIQELLEVFKRV